jgi:uncharacterized protein (TIGR02145 family)
MKKILLSAAFIAASFTGIAQVGIGTTTPAGALDIVSTTSGLVMPRVANTIVVVNPNGGAIENGTMVYDLSLRCINVYANGAWTGCIQNAVAPASNSQVKSNNSGGFYTFLNHNLGADTSLDPHIPVVGLQGGYVQWGKPGPRNWVGAANDGPDGFAAAPTASAANQGVITGWSASIAANGSWNVNKDSPVKVTLNDPCPTGYRVPTNSEWTNVDTYNTDSRTGTFAVGNTEYGSALHYGTAEDPKQLTLPAAGFRREKAEVDPLIDDYANGTLNFRGSTGSYWSSSEYYGTASFNLFFDSGNVNPTQGNDRTLGFSLRCIAE